MLLFSICRLICLFMNFVIFIEKKGNGYCKYKISYCVFLLIFLEDNVIILLLKKFCLIFLFIFKLG